jgi:hypothetical protein
MGIKYEGLETQLRWVSNMSVRKHSRDPGCRMSHQLTARLCMSRTPIASESSCLSVVGACRTSLQVEEGLIQQQGMQQLAAYLAILNSFAFNQWYPPGLSR